ncbi:hypothetical protein [Kordia sp.]|uniref:hypothetical protein n=1 Tax=Kordia sp. TaxID=1965332 RepID=UPI003D2A2F73
MKKKSLFLSLKKYTIASVRGHYKIIGAGLTTGVECGTSVDPAICRSADPATCVSNNEATCTTKDPSCGSSTDDPLSNARKGCASHIGGGD